jgi:hypothetical protein
MLARTNGCTSGRTNAHTNPSRQCFTPKVENVQAACENFATARKKI